MLQTPLVIGSTTVPNRLYRAPVLEGAGSGPDAAEIYARHFTENARAGAGLVIQGNSCFAEEGRTSPGMTLVNTRDRVLALKPMVDAVHAAGARIFLQVGHGGLYAMEAWHEPYASQRQGPLLAASPVPTLLKPAFARVPVHVMTTEEVHDMARRYGEVAAWAREAGYDGVQLASANAKLLDQFLSPFYNRRRDEFGGSLERRAHLLKVIRDRIAEHAGEDYTVTVKIPAEKAPPGMHRTTPDEALRLCVLAEEFGFHAITPVEVSVLPDTTLSRGGIPTSVWRNASMAKRLRAAAHGRLRRWVIVAGYVVGGRRAPFEPVWNRALFTAAEQAVGVPVFAVGGIRTRAEADEILDCGQADMIGIGRPFYAEPDLARRFIEGDAAHDDGVDHGAHGAHGHVLCQNSNLCVPAQMLGMKGVCYNPEVKRATRREDAEG